MSHPAQPQQQQAQPHSPHQATSSNNNSQSSRRKEYVEVKVVGQGTFGSVILARDPESNQDVAIKKVIQDPRFKNRELQIMKTLRHTNVVELKAYFYTNGEAKPDDVYLNVVMEFLPETLHRCCRDYYRNKEVLPMTLARVFMFQLLRSLAYLHLPQVNVCHRDIKPHNLLVDQKRGLLKICDFGSAKQLAPTEPNVAYICSRYYRAPELIFGSQLYSTAIDVWSVGCIFVEMLTGEPVFKGDNSMGQLVEIIKVLGTPSKEQVETLNRRGSNDTSALRLPQIRPRPWNKVFRDHVPPEAHDLASRLLQYVPKERVTPYESLCHPFFEELFVPGAKLPSGLPVPETLFKFSEDEKRAMTPQQVAKLCFEKA